MAMPAWISNLIAEVKPLESTGPALLKFGEAILAEVASSDDPVTKAAKLGEDLAEFVEEIDAAIHAGTSP